MADETLDACLRLLIPQIKADIDTITKTKKQYIVLLFYWCVVYLFSSRKSLFWVPNKKTENFKLALEANIALGMQQTVGLLEQQTSF